MLGKMMNREPFLYKIQQRQTYVKSFNLCFSAFCHVILILFCLGKTL